MNGWVWYAVRASGMVAFALLTVSVVVGLVLSGRVRLRRWPRFAVEDLHGYAGVLAGVFIVLHGAALLVDTYLPFSLADLLVPGIAPRGIATAAGVVAAELLVALALTNRFRKRLPHAVWRRAHMLNFGVWLLALLHGIGAGTDTRTIWAAAVYAISAAAVAGLTVRRVLRALETDAWALRLWPVTAAAVAAELVLALG